MTEGEGRGGMGRGVKMLHTYRQTDRQTDRHTDPPMKWVVEELSLLKNEKWRTAFRYMREKKLTFK